MSAIMEKNKKYFTFISYKREDEEWAKWFQNELENYHLPSTLNGRTDISDILEEIPEAFRPLNTSYTQSGTSGEVGQGRNPVADDELSPSGERSRNE